MRKLKDGYYWTLPKYHKKRVIVEVKADKVAMMGDDRTYRLDEFSDYKKVEDEHPG